MAGQLRRQFGQRLLEIRRQRAMSQEEFAETIGISVDFLSLIERGINSPSFDTLEKITTRLGLPVVFLFTFPEPKVTRNRETGR